MLLEKSSLDSCPLLRWNGYFDALVNGDYEISSTSEVSFG
jgi:hypothetical protein